MREILFFGAIGRTPGGPRASDAAPACRPGHRAALVAASAGSAPHRAMSSPLGLTNVCQHSTGCSIPATCSPSAIRYFRRYGRFLPLRIPSAPQIMHWTYPLPIRLVGAQNIYYHSRSGAIAPAICLDRGQTLSSPVGAEMPVQWNCGPRVSEASRADILRLFPGANPDRVINTYQAVLAEPSALALAPQDVAARLESLFGLKAGGYFPVLRRVGAEEEYRPHARSLCHRRHANPARYGGRQRLAGRAGVAPVAGAMTVMDRPVRDECCNFPIFPATCSLCWCAAPRAVTDARPSMKALDCRFWKRWTLSVPVLTANSGALAEISAGCCPACRSL